MFKIEEKPQPEESKKSDIKKDQKYQEIWKIFDSAATKQCVMFGINPGTECINEWVVYSHKVFETPKAFSGYL